jgi:hypothetical protein
MGGKGKRKEALHFPGCTDGGASFRIDCIVRRGNSKQTGRGKPVYLNTEVVGCFSHAFLHAPCRERTS